MSKKLEEYTKEELIEIIKDLKSRKKFGLVWEDNPEDVARLCETQLPVLEEVPNRAIQKIEGVSNNLIIEGDNYHSLSVLNYTHAGKIDVIYIDPPYNTGNKSWMYNNNFVDKEDAYRHSKWISFMEKRLRLGKSLLSSSGIMVVAIDDFEHHTLRLLMDEMFGEDKRLATIVVAHNPRGRNDEKYIATMHEYMLIYAKNPELVDFGYFSFNEESLKQFNKEDEISKYSEVSFMRTGNNSDRSTRQNLYYPIYYNDINNELTLDKKDGFVEILPINSKGEEKTWRWGKETFLDRWKTEITVKKVGADFKLYKKRRLSLLNGTKPKSIWYEPKYDASSHGIVLLHKIFGKRDVFPYPKSINTIYDILYLTTKKGSTILDYFAGSGTTGHAVLELNKEDGGNRKFILCTNNENGIAEEVTYPRIKNVIDGYANVGGIPANVRYFKTSFVSREQTNDQTRAELVARSADMICLREDTFEKVLDTKLFKVFCGADHYTAIIFDPDAIGLLKNALANLQDDKPVHIYIFSLSNDTYESDFGDLERSHEVRPIPESILEVYRRIFTSQNKTMGAYD